MGEPEKDAIAVEVCAALMAACDEHGPIAPTYAARIASPILTRFEAAARLAGAKEALERAIKIAEAEGNRQTRISFAAQRACYSIWDALSRLRSSSSEPAVKAVGNEKEKP